MMIGLSAGILCYIAVTTIKRKFNYDDSLDAFGIHCIGGITGALMTGLLAQKILNPAGNNGLFFGNKTQVAIQATGVIVTLVYAGAVTFVLLKIIDMTIGLRVNENEEEMGLDNTQHRESAYTILD